MDIGFHFVLFWLWLVLLTLFNCFLFFRLFLVIRLLLFTYRLFSSFIFILLLLFLYLNLFLLLVFAIFFFFSLFFLFLFLLFFFRIPSLPCLSFINFLALFSLFYIFHLILVTFAGVSTLISLSGMIFVTVTEFLTITMCVAALNRSFLLVRFFPRHIFNWFLFFIVLVGFLLF